MTPPRIIILSQGAELLSGRVSERNQSWLARELSRSGYEVHQFVTLPDDLRSLQEGLARAMRESDILLSTGGLGPTQDDLTVTALAGLSGLPLESCDQRRAMIESWYRDPGRGRSTAQQALLPSGASSIPNPLGSAPGIYLEWSDCRAWFMPGVPREARGMFRQEILPQLREIARPKQSQDHWLFCVGAGESRLEALLEPLAQAHRLELSFCAGELENVLGVHFPDETSSVLQSKILAAARERLGAVCLAPGHQTLLEEIAALLVSQELTVATAESCTGGRLSAALTSLPGSSRYFIEGACVYSNDAKRRRCAVTEDDLLQHGAVSGVVAEAMAEGIRKSAGTDLGIATTGIAGPGGARPGKPVGTIWLSISSPRGSKTWQLSRGSSDRDLNTVRTVREALLKLRESLMQLKT